MPVFTPIKLLVLLDRNSNDGRTPMYRYFGVISLQRCQFWLEWILLLLGSLTQTFCILVAHENSTFQHLKFTVSVPCVFGKQVLYWILNFHRTMHWCMFVMLLKVASSLCGLFFLLLCMWRNQGHQGRVFFLLFSKVDIKISRSQADRKSNIIWQDCTNVHARLVFLCSNMR